MAFLPVTAMKPQCEKKGVFFCETTSDTSARKIQECFVELNEQTKPQEYGLQDVDCTA